MTTEEGQERSEVHEFRQRKNTNFQHFEQVPNNTPIRSAKKKQKTEFHALWTNIKYPESLKF